MVGGAAASAAAGDGDDNDGAASIHTTTDSDDEDPEDLEDEDEEDEELRPLGASVEEMEGDAGADEWRRAEAPALQLRSVAAALRKQDDVGGVLKALGRLEVGRRGERGEGEVKGRGRGGEGMREH